MSIPSGLGILTILAFNLVDTWFVSLLGTSELAAISFTFPISFILSSVIIGVGSGLSARLARMLGQGAGDNGANLVVSGLMLGLMLVIVLSFAGIVSIEPLFKLLGASEALMPFIEQYLNVWYVAIIFLVIPMLGNSALRATGNTKTPSMIMALAGLLNAVLDPILIFGLGPIPAMGIQGAAVATLIAWFVSMLGSLYLLYRSGLIRWVRLSLRQRYQHWQQIMKIGRPAALSNMINPLINAILMAMLASADTSAVAAFGVGIRIESLMLIMIMALSSSLTPFIAQNLGAGQVERAHRSLIGSAHFSIISQLGCYVIVALFARPIAHLFSEDAAVIEYLVVFLRIVPLAYGALGIVIMLAVSLNAYNRPGSSLALNLSRIFLLMLPLAWVGNSLLGATGIFAAIAIANILMGGASYLLALRISEAR
jgi:putative MATE family efflux protein